MCDTQARIDFFPYSCLEHGDIVNSRPRSPVVSPSEPDKLGRRRRDGGCSAVSPGRETSTCTMLYCGNGLAALGPRLGSD
jgi:hypothetical protein